MILRLSQHFPVLSRTRTRRPGGLLLLGILLLGLMLPVGAGAVTVAPGSPSTLDIQHPDTVRAGTAFDVTIIVRDAEGNRVENYDELNRQILLQSTGKGDLNRNVISSDQFHDGEVTFSLQYEVAEEIQILAREQGHVAAGQSRPFQVRPGPPHRFAVEVPDSSRAGQSFTASIRVYDRYGNRVTQYKDQTNGVLLETSGLEKPDPEFLPIQNFENGQLKTEITYTVAESIRLILIDEVNGIRSVSDTMQVHPGPLDQFTLSVPKTATAGAPFRIAVEARDAYGNIVRNYAGRGGGVDLMVPSGEQLRPSYLAPDEFENGVAFTQVKYNQTGSIHIRVQDTQAAVEGESSRINVQPSTVDAYRLSVPDEARAGTSFNVQVRAVDRFGNTITDYDEDGPPVELGLRTAEEPRRTLQPSDFKNGVASTTFQVDDVGRFRLEARHPDQPGVSGQSTSLVVVPGPPGNIAIKVPGTVEAGNNFTALLTLQDEFGNRIRETGGLSGTVRVTLMNHTDVRDKTLSPNQFIDGQKSLVFSHDRAETVAVFVEYQNREIREKSSSVTVLPAKFDHLAVRSPGSARAGEKFTLSLQMMDRYGNELRSVPPDLNTLRLTTRGSGNIQPGALDRSTFNSPDFEVQVQYFQAENMSIHVQDESGNRLGVTAPIQILPGPLASFDLQVPDRASAVEAFPLRIEARDPYQNTITNLSERSGVIALRATGDSPVQPRQIQFSQFVDGVVEVPVRYQNASTIKLIARSDGIESSSDRLEVEPGPPTVFEVATQDRVRAGEPFPAVIRVFDEHGNLVRDVPEDFHGVRLSSPGDNPVSPRVLSKSLFEGGEAEVYLAFARTGDMNVRARGLDDPLENPVIDRFFIRRNLDTGVISVLGSGNLPGSVQKTEQDLKIQVNFKPANLRVGDQSLRFHGWFLKQVRQQQDQFGKLPSVVLEVFARQEVAVQTARDLNMYRVTISSTGRMKNSKLQEIQSMIQEKNFEGASRALDKYMQENPGDQQAIQLRFRLQRLKEVLDQ